MFPPSSLPVMGTWAFSSELGRDVSGCFVMWWSLSCLGTPGPWIDCLVLCCCQLSPAQQHIWFFLPIMFTLISSINDNLMAVRFSNQKASTDSTSTSWLLDLYHCVQLILLYLCVCSRVDSWGDGFTTGFIDDVVISFLLVYSTKLTAKHLLFQLVLLQKYLVLCSDVCSVLFWAVTKITLLWWSVLLNVLG